MSIEELQPNFWEATRSLLGKPKESEAKYAKRLFGYDRRYYAKLKKLNQAPTLEHLIPLWEAGIRPTTLRNIIKKCFPERFRAYEK